MVVLARLRTAPVMMARAFNRDFDRTSQEALSARRPDAELCRETHAVVVFSSGTGQSGSRGPDQIEARFRGEWCLRV